MKKDHLSALLRNGRLHAMTQAEVGCKRGKSDIWNNFGFIVLNCEPEDVDTSTCQYDYHILGKHQILSDFVSCFVCHKVYALGKRGGTSTISSHVCPGKLDPNQRLLVPMIQDAAAAQQNPEFVDLPSAKKDTTLHFGSIRDQQVACFFYRRRFKFAWICPTIGGQGSESGAIRCQESVFVYKKVDQAY